MEHAMEQLKEKQHKDFRLLQMHERSQELWDQSLADIEELRSEMKSKLDMRKTG